MIYSGFLREEHSVCLVLAESRSLMPELASSQKMAVPSLLYFWQDSLTLPRPIRRMYQCAYFAETLLLFTSRFGISILEGGIQQSTRSYQAAKQWQAAAFQY